MSRDLKIIIAGRVFQIAITLLAMRLLTTFLSESEVGNYYLLLGTLAFFNLVFLNPPGIYFSRHLLEWRRSGNLFNALFVFVVWMLIVALVAAAILWSVYDLFGYKEKFDLSLYLLFLLGSIVISTIHRNVMFGSNTLGHRKAFVIFLILTLALGLSFSIMISALFYPHALGWLLGVLLAESVMVYWIFRFFVNGNRLDLKKIQSVLSKRRIKSILLFTIPIGITTFLMWGQTIAYRFIVDIYYSAEVLSFIAVGLGIAASVFGSVESVVMQYYNPIFLKKILDQGREKRAMAWNDIARRVVPVYFLTLVFVATLAESITSVLVDSKFHDAYIYVMTGAFLEFFRVMSNLLNSVAQSEYRTDATILPYFAGFIMSLGILGSVDLSGNYLMIAVVLAVAYMGVYGMMYFNMRAILPIKYEVKWLSVLLLSLPLGIIYFVDVSYYSIWGHLALLALSGLYYLFAIWILLRENNKQESGL